MLDSLSTRGRDIHYQHTHIDIHRRGDGCTSESYKVPVLRTDIGSVFDCGPKMKSYKVTVKVTRDEIHRVHSHSVG